MRRKYFEVLIRDTQREMFVEYSMVERKKPLPVKSELQCFQSFMDEDGLMRVSG